MIPRTRVHVNRCVSLWWIMDEIEFLRERAWTLKFDNAKCPFRKCYQFIISPLIQRCFFSMPLTFYILLYLLILRAKNAFLFCLFLITSEVEDFVTCK